MKLIGCQLDIAWENKKANYRRVEELLERTPPEPESLVVLPEMFATGFSMNVPGIVEGEPSETESFLIELARKHRAYLLGGLVTHAEASPRGRNLTVVISPDGATVARYAKMQPFSMGGETEHYIAGDEVVLWDWNGMKVAPFICYDLRFPELFRAAVRRGAELFAVIANWPIMRDHHWVTLLQARAIENQAYVIGVNRCGRDPKFQYSGRSLIIDPLGKVLADAGHAEGLFTADVEVEVVRQWRRDFPALRDMRESVEPLSR